MLLDMSKDSTMKFKLLIVIQEPLPPTHILQIMEDLLREFQKSQSQMLTTINIYALPYGVYYQQPAEFRFSLQGETTEGFSMLVTCPQVNRFYFLRFNWTAIDDKRIEVINVFNVAMVGVTSQLYKFNHNNPNALQGFITLTSFGYGGEINFSVDVNMKIFRQHQSQRVKSLFNLQPRMINYYLQGIRSCWGHLKHLINQIQQFHTSHLLHFIKVEHYDSSNYFPITIPSGQKLITPISGFYFPNYGTLNYRLRRIYSESSTTIVYRWENWDGSYQDLSHKQVWLNLPITQLFTPMLAKKMRGMKKDNPWVVKQDIMKLTIVELNKSFKVSSDSSSFDTDQQVLNMIVYFKCGYWQRVQGSILTCTNCQNKFITLNQNCYKKINEAAYYIKFEQKDAVYQSLDVAVTSTGFTITQKIFNQIQESYTLLSFEKIVKISNLIKYQTFLQLIKLIADFLINDTQKQNQKIQQKSRLLKLLSSQKCKI